MYTAPNCSGTETEDITNIWGGDLEGIIEISLLNAYSEASDPNGANGKYYFMNAANGIFNQNDLMLGYSDSSGNHMYMKALSSQWASTTSSTVTGNAAAMTFIADPTLNADFHMIKSASATTFPYTAISSTAFNGSLNSAFGNFQSYCLPGGPGTSPYGRWHWLMLASTFQQTFEGYSDAYCENSTADPNWNTFVTLPFPPFGGRTGFCLSRVGN